MNGISTKVEIASQRWEIAFFWKEHYRRKCRYQWHDALQRTTTVAYPRTIALRNTGFKTAAGCTAVTRAAADRRKGLRTPGISVKEERRAETRGRRVPDGEGPSRGRARRWLAYAGPFTIPTQPYEKGLSSSFSWFRALRDFWISASLVTRESKTVGQVAASWKEGRERAKQRGAGEGGRSVPFQREPFQKRRATPWMASDLCDYNRKERKKKKEIVRDDISYSPLFLSPTLRSLILLSSSRDANFFQDGGTSPLPDYQKLPAVFSLEIFGLRHSSSSSLPSRPIFLFL